MSRGGSRWSIAMSALFGLSLILPSAVHAATPIGLTLAESTTTGFLDTSVTLTATTAPAVAGLRISFTDATSSFLTDVMTDGTGTASLTVKGMTIGLVSGPNLLHAYFSGDSTYAASTSNTVELDLGRYASSISLIVSGGPLPGEIHPIDNLNLYVHLIATTCDGWIEIDRVPGGMVDSGPSTAINNGDGTFGCGRKTQLGQQPAGTEQFEAFYTNSSVNLDATTGIVDVPVTPIQTSLALAVSPNPVEVGTDTYLAATLTASDDATYVIGAGTVTFYEGSTMLGSAPLQNNVQSGLASITTGFNLLGSHAIHAVWSGPAYANPATSPTVSLSVVPNTVHATGLGLSASTFYPVVDGYGDTVQIEGNLGETASVQITITSATTGAVVAGLWVPTRAASSYNIAWDGFTTTDLPVPGNPFWIRRVRTRALVPAGVYHVTQLVTDGLGAQLTVTSNVTVSYKSLHWYTGSTSLYGNQTTARGGNTGTFSPSPTYYRGERITIPAEIPYGRFAALGYQFTLPSATVYSSLAFSVLGSGTQGAIIGLQDRLLGTWPAGKPWIINYFAPVVTTSTRYGWTTVTGDPDSNRIGRTVRGMVLAFEWNAGHFDVASVKLTYRYAILK